MVSNARSITKLARLDADIASLRDRLNVKLSERRSLLDSLIADGEAVRSEVTETVQTIVRAVTLADTGRRLTVDQVREIRRLWSNGVSQTAIAKRFGLSQPTIYKIVRRQSYQDVA